MKEKKNPDNSTLKVKNDRLYTGSLKTLTSFRRQRTSQVTPLVIVVRQAVQGEQKLLVLVDGAGGTLHPPLLCSRLAVFIVNFLDEDLIVDHPWWAHPRRARRRQLVVLISCEAIADKTVIYNMNVHRLRLDKDYCLWLISTWTIKNDLDFLFIFCKLLGKRKI